MQPAPPDKYNGVKMPESVKLAIIVFVATLLSELTNLPIENLSPLAEWAVTLILGLLGLGGAQYYLRKRNDRRP